MDAGAADRLMDATEGDSNWYLVILFVSLAAGFHSIIPCGSLAGILTDRQLTDR